MHINRNHIMVEHALRGFIRVLMTLMKSLKACSTIIYTEVLRYIFESHERQEM